MHDPQGPQSPAYAQQSVGLELQMRLRGFVLPNLGRPEGPDKPPWHLVPCLSRSPQMSIKIKGYDRQIQRLTETEYCETQVLMTVHSRQPVPDWQR